MKKAAVFAAAMLGFASAAQAVTVNFNEVGLKPGGASPDEDPLIQPYDGGNFTLTFAPSGGQQASYYANSDNFYGTSANDDVSYMPLSGTWQVSIAADAGMEIVFESYEVLRAASASSGEVTVSVNGTTNSSSAATTFGASDAFTRTFLPGSRPTGPTVTLSWADGANDIAIDDFTFTVQAIPEPTVLAPMALAGMGMFLRRRRA